jgi:NTP pyrophosphatase (non-canonical NTP hydrolase)
MNRDKWTDPNVPLEILALKLSEEVGEVSREITDENWPHEGDWDDDRRERLLEELNQVVFLANVIKERV